MQREFHRVDMRRRAKSGQANSAWIHAAKGPRNPNWMKVSLGRGRRAEEIGKRKTGGKEMRIPAGRDLFESASRQARKH
jgi:hypothetical protein